MQDSPFNLMQQPSGARGVEMPSRELGSWRSRKRSPNESQHNREREQLKKKIDALSRQQRRNTADDLGEGAEVDAYEALRDAFKRDDIARIKRGQPGADIRHRALHTGSGCGTIMIDSKNRQGWLSSYVTKLREDQVTEKAEHAILATTIFPSTSQT